MYKEAVAYIFITKRVRHHISIMITGKMKNVDNGVDCRKSVFISKVITNLCNLHHGFDTFYVFQDRMDILTPLNPACNPIIINCSSGNQSAKDMRKRFYMWKQFAVFENL